MEVNAQFPKIIYPCPDQRAYDEMEIKGWTWIYVELEDGTRYRLTFIIPERVCQEAQEAYKRGDVTYEDHNLILIPDVTEENISKAIQSYAERNYFRHLVPEIS